MEAAFYFILIGCFIFSVAQSTSHIFMSLFFLYLRGKLAPYSEKYLNQYIS